MLTDSKICPICGQPNGCQIDGASAGELKCWCTDIKISPAVLARVPVEKRGRACICRSCIEKYR